MKECAGLRVPKPSDKELVEGMSTGVGEVRRMGHEDVLVSMRKIEREIRELFNILEVMLNEGIE